MKLPPLTAECSLGPAHGAYLAAPRPGPVDGLHPMARRSPRFDPASGELLPRIALRDSNANPCPAPGEVCWGEGNYTLSYVCCGPDEICTLDDNGDPDCEPRVIARKAPPDGSPPLVEPPPSSSASSAIPAN